MDSPTHSNIPLYSSVGKSKKRLPKPTKKHTRFGVSGTFISIQMSATELHERIVSENGEDIQHKWLKEQ